MSMYGTVDDVAAYVRHATNIGGAFDDQTTPTEAQVTVFLARRSAMLDGMLAQAGYTHPATNPVAVQHLAYYAVMGAAGDVELTQRAGAYDANDENRRENKFLAEFEKAAAYIASGALGALGVSSAAPTSALRGLFVGGGTRGPIFTRTMFGNDPGAERGTRERDGDWQ